MPPLTLDSADLIASAPFAASMAGRKPPQRRLLDLLLGRAEARPPQDSPWGALADWGELASGLYWFRAPARGGYYLAPRRQKALPRALRSHDGWYEDRLEWAGVAVVFARIFDALPGGEADGRSLYARACETLKHWRPEEYEAWFETTLDLAEIESLPASRFHRERRGRWIACGEPFAALETDSQGRALVRARLGGNPPHGASLRLGLGPCRRFAVPLEELHHGRGRPFVIDPARHAEAEDDALDDEAPFRAPGWACAARLGRG